MSRSTISTFKLFELFPDEISARIYLESRLWPEGVHCPECKSGERIITMRNRPGYYRCNACNLDFTVRVGTIFERSHVPLHKWLYAMYLLVTARKGISSMQLAKEIGITQKSAWFVLHRLREALGQGIDKLRGQVEIDETFIGGLEQNKHERGAYQMSRLGESGNPPREEDLAHSEPQSPCEQEGHPLSHEMTHGGCGIWHQCRCGYRQFFGMAAEGECEECDKPSCEKELLGCVTDAVLAYKPKPKTKAAKRRARRKKRKGD